jgi:hypothetical protein
VGRDGRSRRLGSPAGRAELQKESHVSQAMSVNRQWDRHKHPFVFLHHRHLPLAAPHWYLDPRGSCTRPYRTSRLCRDATQLLSCRSGLVSRRGSLPILSGQTADGLPPAGYTRSEHGHATSVSDMPSSSESLHVEFGRRDAVRLSLDRYTWPKNENVCGLDLAKLGFVTTSSQNVTIQLAVSSAS